LLSCIIPRLSSSLDERLSLAAKAGLM